MMNAKRRRLLLAAIYVALGGVVLALAALLARGSMIDGFLWILGGVSGLTFMALSFRSVEVNDRMLMSSSVMVVFAAGTFFAASGVINGEPRLAVVPMTIVASLGFASPGDLGRGNRWRAAANFGQMTACGFAAGLVIDVGVQNAGRIVLFGEAGADVLGAVGARGLLVTTVAAASASIVYGVLNLVLVRVAVLLLYGRTALVPWANIPGLVGSMIVQGSIGGALGFVLAAAESVALLVFVFGMFVVSHMAFSSYATLRSTHEAMLKGFIKILETRDLYTRGHTERVADFALAIGRELGYSDTQLARLRWAALIHDVGKLAVPTAIMRKQGTLTDDEFHEMRVATHRVDDLLSEVDFLAPMVTICSGVHPRLEIDEDFGQIGHTHSLRATREQSVLAVADAFDAMTSTRSYRMAMNQRTALERLTATNDPLFHPEVLAALGAALSKMPGSYGPPDLASTEVLRA